MSYYKYPIKDKHIRIYTEHELDGVAVKTYKHPEGTTICAYARQVRASEGNFDNSIQNSSIVEFVINKRNIQQDMFVEFLEDGKTYQIGPPDCFLFYNTEIKFQAKEVTPKTYDAIEYEDWLK